MSTTDWTASPDVALRTAPIAEHELAVIIFRAAALGIPEWRVTTALGVPSQPRASDAGAGRAP